METTSPISKKYIAEILIGFGYLVFFCLAMGLCITFIVLLNQQSTSDPINVVATNLPPRYPTPQINKTRIENTKVIFEDTFENNQNDWQAQYEDGIVEIKDGEISFQSKSPDYYAILGCKSCPYLEEPFYFQVKVNTSKPTDEPFGIIFNMGRVRTDYYLFTINTESKEYRLFHHTSADGWTTRISGSTNLIKPFSEANTLGIYAGNEAVEFYINQQLVDTYSYFKNDTLVYEGYFGLFVDSSGFEMIVDDLVIRNGKD